MVLNGVCLFGGFLGGNLFTIESEGKSLLLKHFPLIEDLILLGGSIIQKLGVM